MSIKDFYGRDIEPGHIVVFTQPGSGKNLPPLVMGEVTKVTKAGVTVIYLNKNKTRQQREDYYMQGSGKFWIGYNNVQHEYQERIRTGEMVDVDPVNIRYYEDRFIIID